MNNTIPVVIVMSISYFSSCARMCLAGKATRFQLLFSVRFAFPGLARSEKQLAITAGWPPAGR